MENNLNYNNNFLSRFYDIVYKYGEKSGVITDNQNYTFHQLNEISDSIATTITRFSPNNRKPVALLFGPSVFQVAAIIGVIKSGHPFIPLDISFPVDRFRYIINDSKTAILLTDNYCSAQTKSIVEHHCHLVNLDEVKDKYAKPEIINPRPYDVCAIVYTSGSTGNPKGVVHTHRSLFTGTISTLHTMGFSNNDRVILASQSATIGSLSQTISAFLSGAISYPFSLYHQSLHALGSEITDKHISIYSSTPTLFRNLCEVFSDRNIFNSLRIVRLGGEPVLASDWQLCQEKCGHKTVFQVAYGATETNLNCCLSTDAKRGFASPSQILPVGKAVAGKELLIVDEKMIPVEAGQAGELHISGEAVAKEYLNQPHLTRQKFIELTGKHGIKKSFFRTGDLVLMSENGMIYYKGRIDDQIKIHGNRIETAEVEVCVNQKSEISGCVVKAIKDATDKRLIAFYTTSNHEELSEVELRSHLVNKLPSSMIPERFYHLKKFPLLPNGKINRKGLKPFDKDIKARSLEKSNHSKTVKVLLDIISDIINKENVQPGDNFFHVGGNSLKMLHVLEAIRLKFKFDLDTSAFLENPHINEIAAIIEKKQIKADTGIVHLNPGVVNYPVLFIGSGAYVRHFAEVVKTKFPVYAVEPPNHPEVLAWDGNLNNLRVEKMSSFYVNLIEKYLIENKVIIAGYSFFGILAFEAARQLIKRGREVKALILLDSVFKIHSHPAVEKLEKLRREMNSGSGDSSGLQNIEDAAGRLSAIKNSAQVVEWKDFANLAEVLRVVAKKHYKPEPLNCPGLLFRTDETVFVKALKELNQDYGWSPFFADTLDIIKISSLHNQFVEPSKIREIAMNFTGWLQSKKL